MQKTASLPVQVFKFETGECVDISLLNRHGDPVIDSSWERSHQHGLRSTDQIHLRYLSRGQLNSRKAAIPACA